MNIINIKLGVGTQPCSSITLGRRGENEVTQVVVDFSSWAEEFGTGVITLLAMRSRDSSAYPVVLTLDGNTATWDVTSTDTAFKGSGRAEYIYTVGDQIAKSVVFSTVVLQDIGEPSGTPPDPYEDWLERLTELGAETQANAEAAEQSAEDAAQSAQEAAESAASVEGAVEQAEAARDAARAAQTASEAARDDAQTAQASAESSATAASGSATSAAGSATAAAGSASDASSSASAAGASATTARTAAGQAEAAKTAAQAAQTAAEDAAEDAQQAAQQAHVEYEQLSDAVDDLSDEVAQQKSAIEDLQDLTNRKAGMLVDSVSGAIASFVPDATIENLLGVSVDIEPVQDLHGYDHPWPAGGGTNLLDPGISETLNGVTKTVNSDGTITFTGTATTTTDFYFNGTAASYTDYPLPNGTYHIEGSEGGGSPTYDFFWIYQQGGTTKYANGRDHTPVTVDGIIPSRIFFRVYPEYTINLTAKLGLFAGDYQSNSWTPYSNICPISGWDSVEVDADGENLVDWEITEFVCTRPTFNGYGQGVWQGKMELPQAFVGKTMTYAVDLLNEGQTGGACRIFFYNGNDLVSSKNGNLISSNGTSYVTVTVPECTHYACGLSIVSGTTASNPRLLLGSTATAYRPYAGNRYTISLGQTVYGAKLSIAEDGSVNALVDRAEFMADGTSPVSSVALHSSGIYYVVLTNSLNGKSTNPLPLSSRFCPRSEVAVGNCYMTAFGAAIVAVLPDQTITTKEGATEWFAQNPTRFVYELETPIEIQLDPVTIATIAGQTNNVWADAGDVAVEYAADLKTYIDQKIAATVAALS